MVDILVRDAYIVERDAIVDIAIKNGKITQIDTNIIADTSLEIDAGEQLVSPGLVDAHVHLDMARSAYTGRRPGYNDTPLDITQALTESAAYFADATRKSIISNVEAAAKQAVSNGVLYTRTHAYVDSNVGADIVDWVVSIRNKLSHLLDMEVVAFPQQGVHREPGSEAAVRTALEHGANLVGGLDPETLNQNQEETIETWFDIATDYDVDIDVHVHEAGERGLNTLKEIATKTVQYEYERRVTVSHAYSLADVIGGKDAQIESELSQSIPLFRDAALNFITCYQSTPPYMPIREFHDAGLRMAHGTDQVHDLWGAHGNIDALEAMLVQSLKLESYSTNSGLRTLWKLITTEGAAVLGIEGYGIEPGTPADLVIHNAASPEWAILQNQDPRFVIKDGDVVATNDVEQGLSSV